MIDLARLMLCSQTSFVEKRIHDKRYAKVFKDTAVCLIQISANISDSNDGKCLQLLSDQVNLLRFSLEKDRPSFIFSFFYEDFKYRLLALDMADDIVNSLNSRFVTGNSKTFLGLFDIKGEIH